VKSAAAVFAAQSKREYCMMWTNPAKQAATLNYRFSVE
jgi:hypothetical protein